MNSGAIGLAMVVGICYLILTVIMPAVFFYRYISAKQFVVRFALYQVTGNAYIILWGFIFSFLNIWNATLYLVVLIVLPLLAKLLLFRRDLIRMLVDYIKDKKAKVVTARGTIRNIRRWLQIKTKEAYFRYVRYHYLEILFLLALFLFAVWYYGYFKLHNMTYASSDEATHLYWVNSLFGGDPFPVGMYPHSMHFMIAAIHSLSGMQTLIVNHYFSITIMLMIHFMIFCTVKVLFRSAPAAVGSVGLFLFADMFVSQRYHNTLPMEYGIIAMLAMVIFLHEFMKKRDRLNLWMAALATGWTFHTHFYITIFSAFLWLAFLLVYLKTIIRLKVVLKTLLIIVLAAAVAIAPFGLGLATGQRFEQSIDWALGIMGVDVTRESNVDQELLESVQNLDGDGDENEDPADAEEETVAEQEPVAPVKVLTPIQIEYNAADSPQDLLAVAEHVLTYRLLKNARSALIIYLLLVFAFLYGIAKLIRDHLLFRKEKTNRQETGQSRKEYLQEKQKYLIRNGIVLVVPFMVFFGIFCYSMSYWGLPELIDDSRAAMILSPVIALLFAPPICLVEDFWKMIPVKNKRSLELSLLILVGAGVGAFYAKGPVKQLESIGVYAVTQELSNELSYDLIATHKKNTWTVISPVNDLLAIHHYGFHYEIIDLLMGIEDGKTDIAMPTDDLYIIVEKEVMNVLGVFYLPDYHGDLLSQSMEIDKSLIDANYYDLGLPWRSAEEAYTAFRQVTMSKLYYWMEEIKKAYPNEVEVYSEDEGCIIYHVRQSADFPINLARDYRKENYGVDARDDFERRYAEEHGTVYESGKY